MKMGAGLFWGVLLILIGFSLIIKIVFNIHFPVFRFVIAFFFILLGLKMLIGDYGVFRSSGNDGNVIFSERKIHGNVNMKNEYNVIFGKSEIDLRDIKLKPGRNKVEVNTVFGEARILLNSNIPVKIKSDVAFGNIRLPDGDTGGFGSTTFVSDNFSEDSSYLYLKASAVFGSMKIRFR